MREVVTSLWVACVSTKSYARGTPGQRFPSGSSGVIVMPSMIDTGETFERFSREGRGGPQDTRRPVRRSQQRSRHIHIAEVTWTAGCVGVFVHQPGRFQNRRGRS